MVIIIPIILFGVVGYKSYTENKVVTDFNKYLIAYQEKINTYIFTDNKENYESIIKESDQAILDKDSKKIEELKLTLNQFKEDLLKTNSELVNKNISELESMDISTLDDKESMLPKIEEIKKLRDKNQFIKANEDFILLKTDINLKLEVIKQEEEKRKAVKESKRIEEEKKKDTEEASKNIKGEYGYVEYNKNGFYLRSFGFKIDNPGQNKITICGGHDGTTTILKNNTSVSINDATKEDEGYANHRSGSITGELDYNGDGVWTGLIWDDQAWGSGDFVDGKYIPNIPIKIVTSNNDLIVTVGEKSSPPVRGTHTLLKR